MRVLVLILALLMPRVVFAATTVTFLEPGTDATRDFTFFASTAGTVSSATDQVFTGPNSIKMSTGSPSTQATVTTATGVAADAGTQVSCYIRLSSVSPSLATPLINVQNSSGSITMALKINTTGVIQAAPQGATAVNGTTVVSTNTWHRISLSYFITSTTVFQAKVYLDGNLEATANAGTLTRTGTSQVTFQTSNLLPANTNVWWDNIYVATGGSSSSSQPDTGNILVTAKRPFANGTTNGFTTQIGSGGSGYGSGHAPQVNERPLNTANGWSMVGAGSAVTEEYNSENGIAGDVNVTGRTLVGVQGWVFAKALASETGKIIVDGTQTNISLTSTNTLFTQNSATPTTFPAGTGSDIGIVTSTTLTTVSLYEAGILVAFIQPTCTSYLALLGVGAC